MRSCLWRTAFVLAVLLAGAFVESAQDKGDKAGDLPVPGKGKVIPEPDLGEQPIKFVETPTGVRVGAAMQMLAATNPVVVAAARLAAGDNPLLWPDWELALDAPLPLKSKWLNEIKDGTPTPRMQGVPFRELPISDQAFYLLLCQALDYSRSVPVELFQRAGEKNSFVTFDHLWRQPDLYRGQIVPVIGRMIRLRKWEAPRLAQQKGIEFAYEGWVVGQTPKRNPYCIVFVAIPEGLHEAETMDRQVKFYGYYLKKFRYDAEKTVRETHLVVGPTVFLEPNQTPATPPSEPFTRNVLLATLAGLLGIMLMIAAMYLWFRRGDRRVQARLAALRDRQPLQLGGEEDVTEVRPAPPDDRPEPGP